MREENKNVATADNSKAEEKKEVTDNQTKATTSNNKKQPTVKKSKKLKDEVPRGMPKSKRPWKTPKTKFSTSIKKSLHRNPFAKNQELRNELRHIKELSKEIKEQRKTERIEKHQRTVENAERRLANEQRSQIVQVIKNPAKLKRLKKKQLRMIEKRDLSQVKTI